MRIEHRAPILELDGNGRQQADRQGTKSEERTENDIDNALDAHLPWRHRESEKFLEFKTVNKVPLELAVHNRVKFRNDVNMQRQFANPYQHAHNLLRGGTVVSNDDAADLELLDKGRQIGILAEHREPGELVIHHLETFIDKADHALAQFGSLLEGFGNLAAGLRRAEHEDVVRAVPPLEETAQAKVNEHAEAGHQQDGEPAVNENPGEARAVDVVAHHGLVRKDLGHELGTEQADDGEYDSYRHSTQHTQNLVCSRIQEPRTVKPGTNEKDNPARVQDQAQPEVGVNRPARVVLVHDPTAVELHPKRQGEAYRQGDVVRQDQQDAF